ncbi:MAG: BREX system P-loop protein BrxC [Xenococcus sp. (in: cyanobacteria)]
MSLKNIFTKPIDRPIDGVIKADDRKSLGIEIEEYVLTEEIEKRLEIFLDAYNSYKGANGVWISGFFGSGKSHLLKMLALLLENRVIEDLPILESFLPKCEKNAFLKGGFQQAARIPSKSILFNIDQKADVISKTQIDALLAVFVKVFDEMCGYYGKQGHIAQFERDLDKRGCYGDFKEAYQEIAGQEWQVGREQALLESQNIAKAYGRVTGNDVANAEGILDKYRNQYKVSIEDFADQVYAYLEQQPANFRLNFFVDEVGQYIADNVKLMTNLQTIAESLATKCQGRAWIIVTAQEDMNMVVGEQSQQQGNDFSKIQARFANRMKLNSQDVAEVIQKRLLLKNQKGFSELSQLYDEQSNNFKTLFDFSDGSRTYSNFQDCDHFIHCYPFVPYQFALFQSAIQNLSIHNAFEGKHSSVGERSMLGVFQEVAIKIQDYKIGQLATFDLMFEGISSALKSSIQQSILRAERDLEDKFALKLLKALFLVKYVKEFKPTPRNLCVLMLDDFDSDLVQLRKQVEAGLSLLERETYIQRAGELYEYLTDEEKDIEQEIKNTEVEQAAVSQELAKLIFDHTLKQKKIRSESNGKDYPFSRKMDDRLHGSQQELTIHVITPFSEHAENEETLKMHSMGRDELLVVMPADERLMRDLPMYKRTEKFVKQNISITQKEAVKRILAAKNSHNNQRYSELQQRIETLLGKAKLIVSGDDFDVSSENAQISIVKGFQRLITQTYPNLQMLRGANYREQDLEGVLNQSTGLFATALSDAETEVLSKIQTNKNTGVRTTVKNLLDTFERKPYGWGYAAILCTVGSLLARGKLEIRADGNLLEGDERLKSLLNSREHSNLILDPQLDFTNSQVRALKGFYEDFFDEPPAPGEAKEVAQATSEAFARSLAELESLTSGKEHYPFQEKLDKAIAILKEISGKPYAWYLTELSELEDELLDLKEDVIDPISKFMKGSQREIFDRAYSYLKEQEANFAYIEGDEVKQIAEILNNEQCFKGGLMKDLKTLLDNLQDKVSAQIGREIQKAEQKFNELENRLTNHPDYEVLSPQQQAEVCQPFSNLTEKVATQNTIAVIRDTLRSFEEREYKDLLTKIHNWINPDPIINPDIEYVSFRDVRVAFDKPFLSEPSDVDSYLKSLGEALQREIEDGKRISI